MKSKYFNKDLLAQLRKEVKTSDYPSTFEPTEWKEVQPYSNCLQYALNLKHVKLKRCLAVGAVLGINTLSIYSKKRFEELLCEEWEELGFDVKCWQKSMLRNKKAKRQVIAVYLSEECREWHFIRMDRNGEWSHQAGLRGKILNLDWLPEKVGCITSENEEVELKLYKIFSLTVE